ncbi:MAG: lipid A biosynthesis protein [Nitrospirae bacterium]|nr:MAG: lipid A biosynthesis protein [Nitrospirota bacterium]
MQELWTAFTAYVAHLTPGEALWIGIGFLGQGLFFSRWIVQWIASERRAESQMPLAFWYMSLAGGIIVLSYAIYRKDPVFIAGQSVGAFVYLRNLMLIYRTRRRSRHV